MGERDQNSSSTIAGKAAEQLMIDWNERGEDWLPADNMHRLLDLFMADEQVAEFYLHMTAHAKPDFFKEWIRSRLDALLV